MRKSTLGWLKGTRNPQETPPRVPQLFERLEPRLLLSVVDESVQPTDPVTSAEYAIYVGQQTEDSQASPLSVAGGELGAEVVAQANTDDLHGYSTTGLTSVQGRMSSLRTNTATRPPFSSTTRRA